MSAEIAPAALRLFWQILEEQIGADELDDILQQGGFSAESLRQRAAAAALDGASAGQIYHDVQYALRLYYGHGARGLLLRVGGMLWQRGLAQMNPAEKIKLGTLRWLPLEKRGPRVLETAGKFLHGDQAALSAHTLDKDFMLVVRRCPLAEETPAAGPLCFVTLGLVSEVMYWATGEVYTVSETECLAAGDAACEFHISTGA